MNAWQSLTKALLRRAPLAFAAAVLAGLIDMRLPLTFTPDDAALIARIIRAEVLSVQQSGDEDVAALPLGD